MKWNNGNSADPNKVGSSFVSGVLRKHRHSHSILTPRTPRFTTEAPAPREERLSMTREVLPVETVVSIRHQASVVFTEMNGYRRVDIFRD